MTVIFKNRLYGTDGAGLFFVADQSGAAGQPVPAVELPEPVRRRLDREYLRAVLGPADVPLD